MTFNHNFPVRSYMQKQQGLQFDQFMFYPIGILHAWGLKDPWNS